MEKSKALDNIYSVYEQADAIDRAEGLKTFYLYRKTMREIAARYSVPFRRTVAAFVALSPNNDYVGNLRALVTLLEAHTRGLDYKLFSIPVYGACVTRAHGYLTSEKFKPTKTNHKTWNFYNNICTPSNKSYVTIDGHMANVVHLDRVSLKFHAGARFQAKGGLRYGDYVELYCNAAEDVKLLPCQLQATLWYTWKRLNRIYYSPQLDLFSIGNQWQSYYPVDLIKPFSTKLEKQHDKDIKRSRARRDPITDSGAAINTPCFLV